MAIRQRAFYACAAPLKDSPPPKPPHESESYVLETQQPWQDRLVIWLRSWRGVALLILAIIGLVVGFTSRIIYQQLKYWRASTLIAKSVAAGQRGDDAEEVRRLRDAVILAPSTPLTVRAMAQYHERRGAAAALPAYEQLLTLGKVTNDDIIRAARQGLLHGKPELTRRLIVGLRQMDETRQLPAVLALEAQLLMLDGAWENAVAKAREAARHPGDNAAEQLVLASLLLRADEPLPIAPAAHKEALDILASLAERQDEQGIEALVALVLIARSPNGTARLEGRAVDAWIEAAARHPGAKAPLRVAVWDLRLAARPAEKKQTFSAFVEKWRTASSAEQLEAARWLNSRGEFQHSLDLSTPLRETSDEWFFAHVDSLAAQARWDEVLTLLRAEDGQAARLPKAIRATFDLRARLEMKQPVDPGEAWRDIQILLQNETIHNQLYVAQYAERIGQVQQAAQIYRRLLDRPSQLIASEDSLTREDRLRCFGGLISNTPSTTPAADLLPLFDGLVSEFPEMDEARNDALYLRLLTGTIPDRARSQLQALLERHPTVLAYRTTQALLELRSGNPAAAARGYEGWKIDWTTAADHYKAVRAGVLTANGEHAAARDLRATIHIERLRPEEKALLKSIEE